jgi:hypothetical protein
VALVNRLLKVCTESVDVVNWGNLFHSGMVLVTKCFCSSVVSHRGTISLSWVARPLAALGFLSMSISLVGTATFSLRILYRNASLLILRRSSRVLSYKDLSIPIESDLLRPL